MKWLALSFGFFLSAVQVAMANPPASGQVAWTARSNLIKDYVGRLFYPPTYLNSSLVRVNAEDGSPLWSINLSGTAYFDAACSDSDRLFVLAGSTLRAINPENGEIYWTYQQEGSGSPKLTCMPRTTAVFITFGDRSEQIAAIQKVSGQKIWDYNAGLYSNIFNSDGENYHINRSVDGKSIIDALNPENGEIRWSHALDKDEYSIVDPEGHIFISGVGTISRLSSATGTNQWTFKGEGDWANLKYNSSGIIYVHESHRLNRLDLETGAVLWSRPLENSKEAYSQTILLNSGDLLVRTSYFQDNNVVNSYLEKVSGTIRWEHTLDSLDGSMAEDAAQNLYQIQKKKLYAFDKQNGLVLWTFDLPADPDQNILKIHGQGESFYLTYGSADKFPPMGLVHLNANDGSFVWQQYIGSAFRIVNWDDERVYVAGYMTGEAQAFLR